MIKEAGKNARKRVHELIQENFTDEAIEILLSNREVYDLLESIQGEDPGMIDEFIILEFKKT